MLTNLRFLTLLITLTALTSCKSTQLNQSSALQAGTYKVTILYPNGDDKTFDMDYYEKKHMPMVAGYLGTNLKCYEIDKGISGRTPGDKAPFLAIGYFYVTDVAAYGKAIAQNREAIVSDFKNYTNVQPVIQISEIKQVVYNNAR